MQALGIEATAGLVVELGQHGEEFTYGGLADALRTDEDDHRVELAP
nr:hypothetical protein [Atopobium sp. oral taxon 810]